MQKLLVICGPTATGKTALAIHLAKALNGELVSADSRQVYKDMDIGTGKDIPNKLELQRPELNIEYKDKTYELTVYDMSGVPIWLYDVVEPNEEFSVSHYEHIARIVIADILHRGKLPIVVGGTGLYIKSILDGFDTMHVAPDEALRAALSTKSVIELQNILKAKSIKIFTSLNESDKQNPRRLVRKIEIASVVKPSLVPQKDKYDALCIGLTIPAFELYDRIDIRVDSRVNAGIIQEISQLLALGFTWELHAMSGLGYKEWKPYFTSAINNKDFLKKQCIDQWKYDEHGYARRQMTWFKKQKDIHWFHPSDISYMAQVTAKVREWYTG